MKAFKYPVISITFFLALGIFAASAFPLSQTYIVIFCIASLMAVLVTYWRSAKSFTPSSWFAVSAYLFTAGLGMLSHSLHYAPNYTTHYSHFLTTDETPLIKGYISERLKPNDYSEKYYFEVGSVNKHAATGKLLVTVPKDSTPTILHAGEVLVIADELKPVTKSLNPYQFDYSKYMAGQNVFHQLKLKDNYVIAGEVHNSDYYLDRLRNALINSFSIQNYDAGVTNVLNALLLGQRQDMDKETTTNYTNAGVVHILAISGLHIAVLFYILNLLLKPLHRFAKGRLLKLILILAILWLFAFISGLSASVVRSVLMFSFVSIGLYFNRDSNIYNSIAVSMLFLLLVKPAFLFDVGFQLSYAAVFAIVWLQPVYKKIRASKYKAVNYVADTVLISLVAQIGVLPLSLYYFNQFPLLFLLANVIVIPLSTAVLVLGIIVLLLNFIWADAALVAGKLLAGLTEAMNSFIAWVASFKGLVLKDIPFTLWLTVVLYALIVFFVLWLYKKTYRRTAGVLAGVILFQGLYMATDRSAKNIEELIVFNNWEESLVAIKNRDTVMVLSTDSLAITNRNLVAYNKGNFNQAVKASPLQNLIWFKGKKILVLDSLGVYKPGLKPDVLLLTRSPKINLDRALEELQPKEVIADATNFKTYAKRWTATCRNKKIPFHATAEKGFYRIN